MLNQLLNLFWTLLFFAPLGYYWGIYFAESKSELTFVLIVGVSILIYMLPKKWMQALILGKTKKAYEHIGIKFFRWFVQNGTLIKKIRRKRIQRSGIIRNRTEAFNYLNTIAMQERFHYCCFTFFLLSTVYATYYGQVGLATVITFCNILYNVYPILLQQYNKLRIESVFLNKR